MAVRHSKISWTDHTLNTWDNCREVSSGCAFCYAKRITEWKGEDFHVIRYKSASVKTLVKPLVKPVRGSDGLWYPARIFVNSMSDAFLEEVPDERRDAVFEVMEQHPWVCWQVLTKRHCEMVRYITKRYSIRNPIPPQIWLGVSVENGKYVSRLDALRTLKHDCGLTVAFVSFEPLLDSVLDADLDGLDWAIVGGESYAREDEFRPERAMSEGLALETLAMLDRVGVPTHFKQWGMWAANPYVVEAHGGTLEARIRHLQATGREMVPAEKHGGCMIRVDGKFVLRQDQPAWFHDLTARLRERLLPKADELEPPLPEVAAVIEILGEQASFDLRQAADIVQTVYHLPNRAVEWKKPGGSMPELSRRVYQAAKRLEADGRVAWDPIRGVWARTAA